MNHKNQIFGICAALGMLLLILDSPTAIAGAAEGIELCLRTAIPSLFPFFLLSTALTSSLAGTKSALLRPLGKLCGIPHGSETILLTGLIGGYPVGAQAVAQAYRQNQLTHPQAARMLGFCSNAGPSFIFGIIAGSFPNISYAWALWAILIASAVIVAAVLPKVEQADISMPGNLTLTPQQVMTQCIHVMANVCGWIIGFRMLLGFLNRWIFWLFPSPVRILLSGLLELTNGCCMLTQIDSIGLRFLLCAGLLSFGGLCVTMQTMSVTGNLKIRYYITGKLLQTFICLLLAAILQSFFPKDQVFIIPAGYLAAVAAGFGLLLALKKQKNSSNPAVVGV